jgi:hypothetical protein
MSALGQLRTSRPSFDHLVRGEHQRPWNRQSKRLSGLEIKNELEFCWLLDGKFSRFCASQDLVRLASLADWIAAVRKSVRRPMSALGQKQTFAAQNAG